MDVQYATKGKADAALTTGIIGTVGTGLGLLAGGMSAESCGFSSCNNLTNCTGTGKNSGFRDCYTVHGCVAGGHCPTTVFEGCFADNSATRTCACADTADGGFNNVTNPSA